MYDPLKNAIEFKRYAQDNDNGVTMIPICETEFNSCNESFAYVIRHPDYDFETLENDVALIILPEGRQVTTIRPVTLNRDPNVPVAGQELEAFGWGATDCEPEAIFPNEIQSGMLEYLTNQECSNRLNNAGADGNISDDMMCARTDSANGVAVGGADSGRSKFWALVFL